MRSTANDGIGDTSDRYKHSTSEEDQHVVKVTMPQLGESVAEGTIGKWLKAVGDHVDKYEPLLEVITDKVNAEVPSPYEGVLTEILVQEGETVPNNAEIAVIDEVASSAVAAAPAAAAAAHGPAGSDERPARQAEPVAATAASAPAAVASAPSSNGHASPAFPEATPGDADARMTPAVRRLLREHGLTAAQIVGTGGGGRITREDVLDFVEAARTGKPVGGQGTAGPAAGSSAGARTGAAPAAGPGRSSAPAATAASSSIVFPAGADEVLVPMTQMRKGIAAQMTRSLAVPHAYVQMEVDVSGLVRLRESQKRDYQAKEGISLSFVPFVVQAAAQALKAHPNVNGHWTDEGFLAKRHVNVGVAVAVEEGLIVPVVRDVDQLSVHGINRAIADVSSRARANKLRLDDFGGGTFTVDNTGWLGTNLVMPIINVPEVAIVTMEAITKRAVVVETKDGDMIAIRPIMNMVLAVDHRANDGAGGAAFLRDIKAALEGIGPDSPVY